MQRFIFGVLAVALSGAGGTVFLVDSYIDKRIASNDAVSRASNATVQVLVAKNNIPIGKKIARSDLVWQSWPKSGVQGEFVSDAKGNNGKLSGYVGTTARRGIIKGTPITHHSVFKSNKPGFLAGALDPNMRAMAVAISAQSGAAGFILPGDRVDVILTLNAKKNSRDRQSNGSETPKIFLNHVAETILQNVRVLAADQKLDDFDKKAKVAKTVTLEVTPKQAEKLAVAASMGKLSLALRSLSDVTKDESADQTKKMAIAEAIRAAKGPTMTTDIEVSRVLASTAAAEIIDRLQQKSAPPRPASLEGASGESKPGRVRLYRDGAPSMVNF